MEKEKVTIAYEKSTGSIIATHIGEEPEFLDLLSKDLDFLKDHQLKNVKELETTIIDIDRESNFPGIFYVKRGVLVKRLHLTLSTDASDKENPNGIPEVKGDGSTSCKITARVLNTKGNVEKAFGDNVRFSTSRGRLSEKNGIVKAKKGIAEVTLTSSPETVAQVFVRAGAAGCMDGLLELEFY